MHRPEGAVRAPVSGWAGAAEGGAGAYGRVPPTRSRPAEGHDLVSYTFNLPDPCVTQGP